MNKRKFALFVLFACLLSPCMVKAQNATNSPSKNYENSAWVIYESAVNHINGGEVILAKQELRRILDGMDKGEFVECFDNHTVRLLKYKSHTILANIAFAEKDMWELDREIAFFINADTTQSEWKRANFAATHFKHKYHQLSYGKFGKAVGDWVSVWQNKDGIPMVWIRFYVKGNTLYGELMDCAMKGMLTQNSPHISDKIVVDNIDNVIEVNFGDSKLRQGLQILPSAAIKFVYDMADVATESVAAKSIAKNDTPYSSESLKEQTIVDAIVLLATILITRLAVSKETVVAESFVLEQITNEICSANIKFRKVIAYSDGRYKDKVSWAKIPMFHLYPNEALDFSKGHFNESLKKSSDFWGAELIWDDSEGSKEFLKGVAMDLHYGSAGICNVEDAQFKTPFYFLGKNINYRMKANSYTTSFSGLAKASNLWGFKEEPINPITGKSEANPLMVPIRGVFKTIISPNECVTFTGDWNASEKCGNGLLSYVNTDSPEFNFTYEGTILKGRPHGLGIWQGSGYRYVGWFYKGKKIGYGTMRYDDGREERGFVTEDGTMIPEETVPYPMKADFDEKVNKISKLKYQVLDD